VASLSFPDVVLNTSLVTDNGQTDRSRTLRLLSVYTGGGIKCVGGMSYPVLLRNACAVFQNRSSAVAERPSDSVVEALKCG